MVRWTKALSNALLIAIILLSFAYLLSTPKPSSFIVTIRGEIVPSQSMLLEYESYKDNPNSFINGYRPERVYVNRYLLGRTSSPRGEDIGSAYITWENITHGSYSLSLELGLPTSLVLSAREGYNVTYVSRSEVMNLPIVWQRVDSTADQPKLDAEAQIERVESLIRNIDARRDDYGVRAGSVQEKNFSADIDAAKDEIAYAPSNKEEMLRKALYAEWFARRAEAKLELFKLEECVNEIEALESKYIPLFYVPSFTESRVFESSQKYLNESRDGYIMSDENRIYNYQDNDSIIKEIESIRRSKDFVQERRGECEAAFSALKENYHYQKTFFWERLFALIAMLVASILIGTLLEAKFRILSKLKAFFTGFRLLWVKHSYWFKKRTVESINLTAIFTGIIGILAADAYTFTKPLSDAWLFNAKVSVVIALIAFIFLAVSLLCEEKRANMFRVAAVYALLFAVVATLATSTILTILNGIFAIVKGIISLFAFLIIQGLNGHF